LIRLAIFGAPVSQSKSPAIHTEFGRQLGLDVHYQAIHTEAGALREALAAFAAAGGNGANITAPLKHEAMELADTVSDAVRLAEAANVLVRDEQGQWAAHNTDGAGLVYDMTQAGWPITGQRIAILGAGGATGGILGALLAEQPASIDIFNRTAAKAESLAARHAHLGEVRGFGLDAVAGKTSFDLVINATSLGHRGEVPEALEALLSSGVRCQDLNYGVAAQPLTIWCTERGIAHREGLGMLIQQAVLSFELWTGLRPGN
jgi:shikimate dehydrogenase